MILRDSDVDWLTARYTVTLQGATKIVKVVIEHPNYMAGEEIIKRRTPENDPFFRTEEKSQFSPDVTPLILAAQYNNHEIVQMFLSRNHTIERPHVISCSQSLTSLRRTVSVISSKCVTVSTSSRVNALTV